MPDPTKLDRRLPRGVTVEDLWARKRRQGLPHDPYVCRYLGKALIPGTRRYKTRAFNKRRDAVVWAEQTRSRLIARLEPSDRCRVADHMEAYLDLLRSRRLDENYIRHVRNTLESLIKAGAKDLNEPHFYMIASESLVSRKAVKVAGGRVRRRTRTELSPSTVNRYIAAAKAFSTWCYQEGLTTSDVLARLRKLREEKRVKPTLTWAELRALLDDKMRDDPFWLMACLMAYTGMRAGEAAYLRWDDVRFDEQMLVVRLPPKQGGREYIGMKQKSKAERYIYLQPELKAILEARTGDREGFVLSDNRYRRAKFYWRTDFDAMLRAAGIKKRRGISPHSFRHSYAAMMTARTGNVRQVQMNLGHASIKTTESYAASAEACRPIVEQWPEGRDMWIRRVPGDETAQVCD